MTKTHCQITVTKPPYLYKLVVLLVRDRFQILQACTVIQLEREQGEETGQSKSALSIVCQLSLKVINVQHNDTSLMFPAVYTFKVSDILKVKAGHCYFSEEQTPRAALLQVSL